MTQRSTHQFWIALQPIAHLGTGDVVAHEALLRDGRGFHTDSATALFREAAREGQQGALEQTALDLALRRVNDLPMGQKLFVNVGEPAGPTLPAAADPARVVLEVSEGHNIVDNPRIIAQARAWREAGYAIALDDYGVGHMGLGALLVLKPQIVKLDRLLIRGLDHDPARQAILRSVQRLAQDMDLTVIAEGIETTEELAYLRTIGVHYGQGFLLGRPEKHPRTQISLVRTVPKSEKRSV